jgi:hypothetical protein
MGDEYTDRLKAMIPKKSSASKDLKRGYKEMHDTFDGHYKEGYSLYKLGEKYLWHYQSDPNEGDFRDGMTLKVASELMRRGIKDKDLEFSLGGLELYNALGLADRKSVKRRFEKAAKLDTQGRYRIARAVEIFENPNKQVINKHDLEGKAISGILILSVLGGMIFLSPNLTGNVIGNMTKSSSNILGLILFVVGIVGVFIQGKVK